MNTSTAHPFKHLFSPVRIGRITLKNRIAVAPMTRVSASEEGLATDVMAQYYSRFARGGFGLLITEGTYTDTRYSQGYLGQPGIATDAQAESWRKVVNAVHESGARVILQLMHAGGQAQGNRYMDHTAAPSTIPPRGEQLGIYRGEGAYPVPRAMTQEDIAQVKRDFVAAALRARQAGFDGIEIHGANGYLLDQFLTDYTNQRNDAYGGSTENRVRLPAEICRETRDACGPDFTIGIRISQAKVSDYHHKWASGEGDARIIFEQLGDAGIDYIHTTEYRADAPAFGQESRSLARLAKDYGRVAVIANGNMDDPAHADALIASGQADVIALGKRALANRDWPRRAQQQEEMEEFDFSLLQPLADIKPQEL